MEYERVCRGEFLLAIDTTRYKLETPPVSQKNSVNAWKNVLDNAYAQYEHQYLR